jgi:predicted nucleic acid-binding protein
MESAAPELPAPEVLVCDTSFLGHFERSLRDSSRYRHWPRATLDRIAAAVAAITPFTLAEIRFGYTVAGWGAARIAAIENRLAGYVLIPLDSEALDEYVRLAAHARSNGIEIGHNDLWIAATAGSRDLPLVTSDRTQAQLPGVATIYLPPPP